MDKIEIYTDGSCLGNPGDGGWCAILKMGKREKVLSDFSKDTTNNIMELCAVLNGLDAVKKPCDVTVYSDSQYICQAFNDGWIENWKQNGWITSAKKPVKNKDFWFGILETIKSKKLNVKFEWVKGHADNEYNNRCDEIARKQAKKAQEYIDDGRDFIEIT